MVTAAAAPVLGERGVTWGGVLGEREGSGQLVMWSQRLQRLLWVRVFFSIFLFLPPPLRLTAWASGRGGGT